MKLQNVFSRILDGLILLVFVLIMSSAGFQDKSTSGWYQQWFPNLNGSTIKDITFLDSLTGFAVTTTNSSVQAYILKTTNGGDNWSIVHTYVPPSVNSGFNRIQFSNNNTGYTSTNYFDLFKTTDNGLNWVKYPNQPTGANDFYAINTDTLFYVSNSGFGGGVYRSINGGVSWSRIWTNGTSDNPDKIYMYDKNIGFSCNVSSISYLRKTTNGGFNWFDINVADAFLDLKLVDSLTGWKGTNSIQKTTDGGITWFVQTKPNVVDFIVRSISIINRDTVWLGGDGKKIIGNTYYGALGKTTNGGTNWGYQIPNMAIDSGVYYKVNFSNKNCGWAYINYARFNDGIHTKVGGNDSTVFTGINNDVGFELSEYQLFQNYPNPFNPSTTISYKLSKSGNVNIKVFNISGKEIEEIVNKRLQAGPYNISFNATKYSSGIYFYSMFIDGKLVDTKKMMFIK
jgi:photosystem II stability/assembly factor-like uncharacterized protein